MSYVDDNLLAGESVVYRTRLHWAALLGPAVATSFFLLLYIVSRGGPWLLLAVIAGLTLLARFAGYKAAEFAVTNKRVVLKVGILRRRSVELLLSKVEAIGVDQ